MRLTEKYDDGSYGITKSDNRVEHKLGQLEDIEEELGIDLATLFKILTAQKLYIKGEWANWNEDNSITESNKIEELDLDYDTVYLMYTKNYFYIKFHWGRWQLDLKKYGKTWALTKEELE